MAWRSDADWSWKPEGKYPMEFTPKGKPRKRGHKRAAKRKLAHLHVQLELAANADKAL